MRFNPLKTKNPLEFDPEGLFLSGLRSGFYNIAFFKAFCADIYLFDVFAHYYPDFLQIGQEFAFGAADDLASCTALFLQ